MGHTYEIMGLICPLGTFCPLGRFVPCVLSPGTFCPLGRYVPDTFCPWDVLSWDVLSWDVLYVHQLGSIWLKTRLLPAFSDLARLFIYGAWQQVINVVWIFSWAPRTKQELFLDCCQRFLIVLSHYPSQGETFMMRQKRPIGAVLQKLGLFVHCNRGRAHEKNQRTTTTYSLALYD